MMQAFPNNSIWNFLCSTGFLLRVDFVRSYFPKLWFLKQKSRKKVWGAVWMKVAFHIKFLNNFLHSGISTTWKVNLLIILVVVKNLCFNWPMFIYFQFSNMIPDYVITGRDFRAKGPGGYLCTGFWDNTWNFHPALSSCSYCAA